MNKINNFIIRFICFLPPILQPTGLYMANDPDILSLHCTGKNEVEYRVPDNKNGGRFDIENSQGKRIHVYVNKDREGFMKKMNPGTTEKDVDNRKVTSLSDEKTIGIFFGIFRKKWPNRKMSLQDAFTVMSMIYEALQQRPGQKIFYQKMNGKKQEMI